MGEALRRTVPDKAREPHRRCKLTRIMPSQRRTKPLKSELYATAPCPLPYSYGWGVLTDHIGQGICLCHMVTKAGRSPERSEPPTRTRGVREWWHARTVPPFCRRKMAKKISIRFRYKSPSKTNVVSETRPKLKEKKKN
jgi:hypothetical protein